MFAEIIMSAISHHSEVGCKDLCLGVHSSCGGELLDAQVNVHHVGRDCQRRCGILKLQEVVLMTIFRTMHSDHLSCK